MRVESLKGIGSESESPNVMNFRIRISCECECECAVESIDQCLTLICTVDVLCLQVGYDYDTKHCRRNTHRL